MHYAPEPEGFDLDKNGYVSLAEIIDVNNYIHKTKNYLSDVLIEDPYNLLPNFYLGDLRVREDEDI
jgi:RNA:NAD 2'-phosphotransferase (TPT1/KptA family)